MTAEQITEIVQNWFASRIGMIDSDQRYGELSAIDSFDILQLVLFCEDTFGIRFSSDDFASPSFATLAGMAQLIHARIA